MRIIAERLTIATLLTIALSAATACRPEAAPEPTPEPSATPEVAAAASLEGVWRAVVDSAGRELPFTIVIGPPGSTPPAYTLNGEDRAPFSHVVLDGDRVELRVAHFDSRIDGRLEAGGTRIAGEWSKTVSSGRSTMSFVAVKGDERRFREDEPNRPTAESAPEIDGDWRVEFGGGQNKEIALGRFKTDGETASGTFLTPTGDYRFLAGDYRDGALRLSCFDGGHVFLFHARGLADGTLEGSFWSRGGRPTPWAARRLAEGEPSPLPDPFNLASIASEDKTFRFSFPDETGKTVDRSDPRFEGKVVLVNIFGTWCPNCNDETPLLVEWDRRYRDRGLEIVGLAYEYTDDFERSARMIEEYRRAHGIEYTVLIAGTSNKSAAAATLPDLDKVVAFPTNVFIGRDGRARRVHTGFTGPATGEHYDRLRDEFVATIEELLAETPRP
jgi:thiol-disulfide isomerase/thioredoxin